MSLEVLLTYSKLMIFIIKYSTYKFNVVWKNEEINLHKIYSNIENNLLFLTPV